MQAGNSVKGHVGALISILIWGTTFVSTKVLLRSFTPVEILVLRMAIGTLALFVVRPRRLRLKEKKHHLYFLGAGLSGICIYYLMENIALTYTNAANVGVIVSVAPLFIAILCRAVYGQRLRPAFFVGFAAALLGIGLISFVGADVSLNPLGDLLALLAAASWAVYTLLVRKIGSLGYDNVLATRRVFLYGLVFMVPAALGLGFSPSIPALVQPVNIGNFLFLGLGASALCFVTWNLAVRELGNLKSGVYIYAVPVVTVVSSAIVLGEQITAPTLVGILLTLAGLVISEIRFDLFKKKA